MKIYTIEHKEFEYDSFLGHVIVANNEKEVIELAKKDNADEGEKVWDTATIEKHGDYTCDRTKPFILMSDFRAG